MAYKIIPEMTYEIEAILSRFDRMEQLTGLMPAISYDITIIGVDAVRICLNGWVYDITYDMTDAQIYRILQSFKDVDY